MTNAGKTFLFATTAVFALGQSGAAFADGDALADLQRQILLLQSQIDELKAASDCCDHKVKFKAFPEISSGDWSAKVRGRLMLDWATVDGDAAVLPGEDDYIENAIEARRARLGIEGKMPMKTAYKLDVSYNAADSDIKIEDAYLQWKTPAGKLTAGQHKPPVSLEKQTSSLHTTFMERAAFTDAFGFKRRVGVSINPSGDNWSVKAGVFGANLEKEYSNEGYMLALRGTYAPINEKDRVLHLGASVNHEDLEESSGKFKAYQRPQVHQEQRFLNTWDVTAESVLNYGVEGAAVIGPFSAQAEYSKLELDTPSGSDPELEGYYVDLSWFLTGESRKYKASKGAFDRVTPKAVVGEGGWGAWQVALRYDHLDLTDVNPENMGPLTPGTGGEQDAIIAGVNWHLNDYVKLMANYSHVEIKDSEQNYEVTGVTDNEINAFQLRAQVDW